VPEFLELLDEDYLDADNYLNVDGNFTPFSNSFVYDL